MAGSEPASMAHEARHGFSPGFFHGHSPRRGARVRLQGGLPRVLGVEHVAHRLLHRIARTVRIQGGTYSIPSCLKTDAVNVNVGRDGLGPNGEIRQRTVAAACSDRTAGSGM